jgi:hypothetical protein
MVRTLYTDNQNELEISHDDKKVTIEIRATNWLENPTECISVQLDSFDIYELIDDLTLLANHCNPKIQKNK